MWEPSGCWFSDFLESSFFVAEPSWSSASALGRADIHQLAERQWHWEEGHPLAALFRCLLGIPRWSPPGSPCGPALSLDDVGLLRTQKATAHYMLNQHWCHHMMRCDGGLATVRSKCVKIRLFTVKPNNAACWTQQNTWQLRQCMSQIFLFHVLIWWQRYLTNPPHAYLSHGEGQQMT